MVTFKIALIFYEWRSVMFSVEQITFLFCHGDIESNTGPTRLKPNYLSLCQISAAYLLITFQTFSNTFQSIYNYDFICLSET